MHCKYFFLALSVYWLSALCGAQEIPTTPAQAEKIVVVYGDSITAGGGLKNPEQRWASLVESQSKGLLMIANEGKGGRPTNSLSEFDEMLKRRPHVDLLVIALGANDARDISGRCVPSAVRNLTKMIDRARETYGVALPILVVGPTNINKDALGPTKPIGPQREANLAALDAAFSDLAKAKNCTFVSTYGSVPDAGLAHDGVHPDAAGHIAIAKIMLPAIAKAADVAIPE